MEDSEKKIEIQTDLLELSGRGKGELVLVDPFSIASAVPQGDGSTKIHIKNSSDYKLFVKESPEVIHERRKALIKNRYI
jgi:hypothetical protein